MFLKNILLLTNVIEIPCQKKRSYHHHEYPNIVSKYTSKHPITAVLPLISIVLNEIPIHVSDPSTL